MGKVRTAIEKISTNLKLVKKNFEKTKLFEALEGWRLLKKQFVEFDQLVAAMSGKTKDPTKTVKIALFQAKIKKFVDKHGDDLDNLEDSFYGK